MIQLTAVLTQQKPHFCYQTVEEEEEKIQPLEEVDIVKKAS